MLEESIVRGILDGCVAFREVARLPRGHIRVETALQYPDGSFVDVYILAGELPFGESVISDLGNTLEWLFNVQVRPWTSKARSAYLNDVVRQYGVIQEGGALTLRVTRPEELAAGILKLGQACMRVADIVFTRRMTMQTSFRESVEEVLSDTGFEYEVEAAVTPPHGRPVRLNFLVQGRTTKSGILIFQARNSSQAHNNANEIFRRWYDLRGMPQDFQKLTVYDDSVNVYRGEDLEVLQEWSTVVPFSQGDELRELLAA